MSSKFGKAWERISLRTKLTALSVALIGVLLLVSSLGTISLLRTYLQANVDTLLTSTSIALKGEDPALLEDRLATRQLQLPSLPTDFYIAYLDEDGTLLIGLVSSANDNRDVPNLSNFSADYVLLTQGIPFEVNENGQISDDSGVKGWRMVAVPLTSMPGSLVVALPTGANNALLSQYGLIGGGFGTLLLILSALSIWLTISSALKPLNEVERTAEAVTEGDISQRLMERDGDTEIARLNRSLNTMLDGIETAMQDRSKTLDQMRRFVADASHELRTPLVSVRGYAELHRMGALKTKKDVAQAMDRIEKEAIRMGELVEDLLELARLDETRPLEITTVDLLQVAQDAALDARAFDPERTITVTGSPVDVMVEENKIRQVVTNLMGNALRFTNPGTPLELEVSQGVSADGIDEAVISIVDHGDGIPKQLREKIFQRFYRADNSRDRATGGSGLGLAIVASIVEAHHGTIDVTATKGGGATFNVHLPLVHVAPQQA